MATITIDSSINYDLCSGQTTGATLDLFSVNNGRVTVDTDTKFCSGHVTSTTASNGSLDSVTIASTAISGELKLDGTNIWMIPIRGGAGTAPTPIAIALVPTVATYTAPYVTLTFAAAHGYIANDRIGVGSIRGSELVNGYCGMFTIFDVPTTTTLRYAVSADPGTSTITTGKVLKYFKCDQTQTRTVTTGTGWSAGIVTFAVTVAHTFAVGNSVIVTGVTPSGYNGTYTITGVGSTTFTAALVTDPAVWVSGGTVTKTVNSTYLGAWSVFTAGPTVATIPASGWLKVKDLVNGPFEAGVSLVIQGGTTPVATVVDAEQRAWIEVVGGEITTTPAVFTIPRLGKFTVTGDWFYPKTATPFALATGTSWTANVTTYTTVAAHGLAVGSIVRVTGTNPVGYNGTYTVVTVPSATTFTAAQPINPGVWVSGGFGWGEITTNGVAQQTIQLPASGGTVVGTTSYAGVWVETARGSGTYEFYPCVGNATATVAMFATDSVRGKVCYMGASGLVRFGGDGTNIWGFLPPVGCRVRIPNVISVEAEKVATTGVFAQTVPDAVLTNRPLFVTTSAGVISIDKWQTSWYCIFQQPYSVNLSFLALCESMLVSEIAQPVVWNEVNTGMSVIASSAQASSLTMSTCYAGGTIDKSAFNRFHVGTAGWYAFIGSDLQAFNFTNCVFSVLMTTAVGGAVARNAVSGAISLARVANSNFTTTDLIGRVLHTTTANLTFTTTRYADSRNIATGITTPQSIHSFNTNTAFITIDGITFGGVLNVHPYTGIIEVLSGSNNIKVRNIGSATAPLSLGSANAAGVIFTGAAGGVGYNIEFKRIYCTSARTGVTISSDNSYNNIVYESVWCANAALLIGTSLNTTVKGLGHNNATAGQTSVYGYGWQDFFTPDGATLATGTAWSGGTTTYTTVAAHNLLANDVVTISGVVASVFNAVGGYNGTYTVVTAPTATTFTVAQVVNPGTWTSGGVTNPLLGKIVLQMNEQTAKTPAYTFDKSQLGSGFTSVGNLVLLNLDDTITWETPYYILGHRRFTTGALAPFVVAQPTFTSTNPNNHDWTYDIDKGAGYSGIFKNLHYKSSRGSASWAITGTTTCTLTPVTCTCVGSITGEILTVTSVSSGYLYEGMTLTGTGVTAGTVITEVTNSPTGRVGSYKVKIMTVASGTYTLGTSTQTVASTTITASTSVYGLSVGDNVFNLTTPANVATNSLVSSISSLTVFVLNLAGVNSTLQVLAFSAIHSDTGIVAATGFKLKVRCKVNTVSLTNTLTTVSIPTLTNSTFQQAQYPLDPPVTISITVQNTVNQVLQNVTVGVYTVANNTQLIDAVTNVDGVVSTLYDYTVNTPIVIKVRRSGTGGVRYVPFSTIGTITSTGFSLTVTVQTDPIVAA